MSPIYSQFFLKKKFELNWLRNSFSLYFSSANSEYQGLPSFLLGESMGGAVALKVHLRQPQAWDGAVLVAPMCKVIFCLWT